MHWIMKINMDTKSGYYQLSYMAIIILCLLFLPQNALSQNSLAFRELPTLRLSIFQISPSINAPMDGEILLTNLTNKTYDIQNIKIHLPQGLLSIRPDFKETIRNELHSIGGEDERIYSFGVPGVTMSFVDSIVDTKTLLFVPGQYRLRAEVVLKESGNEKGIRSLYATTELTLEPPLNAVLRGGVIGALLLSLFVPAYSVLYNRRNKLSKTQFTLQSIVCQFIVYFVSGSIVSITAILLIHRIGSANLPISITVNDYLGGIIIGLFSYVIGNMLYNKFFDIDIEES